MNHQSKNVMNPSKIDVKHQSEDHKWPLLCEPVSKTLSSDNCWIKNQEKKEKKEDDIPSIVIESSFPISISKRRGRRSPNNRQENLIITTTIVNNDSSDEIEHTMGEYYCNKRKCTYPKRLQTHPNGVKVFYGYKPDIYAHDCYHK